MLVPSSMFKVLGETTVPTTYNPAVRVGEWANYTITDFNCAPSLEDPSFCQSEDVSLGFVNETDHFQLRVVEVAGTLVTLEYTQLLKNMTVIHKGILADVSAGTLNATVIGQDVELDYLVIAGRLPALASVWSTPGTTILQSWETFLDVYRVMNNLGIRSHFSKGTDTFFLSDDYSWDQITGILTKHSLSLTSYEILGDATSGEQWIQTGHMDFDLVISAGDFWPTPPPHAGFKMTANPVSVVAAEGSTSTSTISVFRDYGCRRNDCWVYSGTIDLTAAASSSELSCSLLPGGMPISINQVGTSSPGPQTSTLSCTGLPGQYDVIVTGLSDNVSETVTLSVSIVSLSDSNNYAAAVSVGQWAKYSVLYYYCWSSVYYQSSSICPAGYAGKGSMNDTEYFLLRVADVTGTLVTFQYINVYKNGTRVEESVQVDTRAGKLDMAVIGQVALANYLLLAGDLQAGQPIWDKAESSRINQTSTLTVLGTPRRISYLNFTTGSPQYGYAWDDSSGMIISLSYSASAWQWMNPNMFEVAAVSFEIGLTDTNIWPHAGESQPDFTSASSNLPRTVADSNRTNGAPVQSPSNALSLSPLPVYVGFGVAFVIALVILVTSRRRRPIEAVGVSKYYTGLG